MEKPADREDALSTHGRVHDSVAFRIRAGWNKFKVLSCMLFGRCYL